MIRILCIVFFSFSALAADPVCVRNYDKGTNFDICQRFPQFYAYVIGKNKSAKVCTRIYSSFYCQQAKQYALIPTKSGKTICTMNYNQPPVANYCKSVSQLYDYVEKSRSLGEEEYEEEGFNP